MMRQRLITTVSVQLQLFNVDGSRMYEVKKHNQEVKENQELGEAVLEPDVLSSTS